jgi:hypothetical protein
VNRAETNRKTKNKHHKSAEIRKQQSRPQHELLEGSRLKRERKEIIGKAIKGNVENKAKQINTNTKEGSRSKKRERTHEEKKVVEEN